MRGCVLACVRGCVLWKGPGGRDGLCSNVVRCGSHLVGAIGACWEPVSLQVDGCEHLVQTASKSRRSPTYASRSSPFLALSLARRPSRRPIPSSRPISTDPPHSASCRPAALSRARAGRRHTTTKRACPRRHVSKRASPSVRLTLRRAVSNLVPPFSSRPAPSTRREYSRTPYPSVRLTLCPP